MEKSLEYTSRVNRNKANDYLELCRQAENALYDLKHNKSLTDVKGYSPYDYNKSKILFNSHFKAVIYNKNDNIGEDFIVKCNYEEVRKGPLNRLDQHRLDSFGDCNDAVTPAVFKKQNPKFKNKFRNEQLSAEDISSIPEEYYGFVEEDINASIATFGTEETNPQHNSSQCPGTYQVSGYTREDGTKVPAHVRTCHVHNSL